MAGPILVCQKKDPVLNIAVYPYTEVQISVFDTDEKTQPEFILNLENFGNKYTINTSIAKHDKHPLLQTCIDIMNLPSHLSLEVNLHSDVPPGCSTGTSAAISVALLSALDLLTPATLTSHELTMLAHKVETEKLPLQCAIQDQLFSAYGGICYTDMFSYHYASVSQ